MHYGLSVKLTQLQHSLSSTSKICLKHWRASISNGLCGCVYGAFTRVHWCMFHVVPFVYRLTLILKMTGLGLFNVINQKGNDWLLLNMIKWSSELSLHAPSKLFESIRALKTSLYCENKVVLILIGWEIKPHKRIPITVLCFNSGCRVRRVILWSKSQWVRVQTVPEWRSLCGWSWPVSVLLLRG